MKESTIERKLRHTIERRGGLALKLDTEAGQPDRLLLLPGGKAMFVETKNESGRVSPRQAFFMKRLTALGFEVYVLNSAEAVDKFDDELIERELFDRAVRHMKARP